MAYKIIIDIKAFICLILAIFLFLLVFINIASNNKEYTTIGLTLITLLLAVFLKLKHMLPL